MSIAVPDLSLVVLVGTSGSGKSTFAAKHFAPTEILSSDRFRAMVCDDETDPSVSAQAFEVLHLVARKRLALGRLTLVDATNVQAEARAPLLRIAREQHVLATAIVLDVPASVCIERNASRPERSFGPHVVHHQRTQLRKSVGKLKKEGFRHVYVLRSIEEIESAIVTRQRLWTDRRDEHGPFDVIGDVHGCASELATLLERLGYARSDGAYRHPEGRKAVFLGDLVDRGPDVPGVLRTAMAMVRAASAICIPGNHEVKLERALSGRDVKRTHGLAQSLEQLAREPEAFIDEVRTFIDSLVSHCVLDEGRLVVAHAGLPEALHGRASGRVRQLCLYGETSGETDDLGLPVRIDWAQSYRGRAAVVYGHTPVAQARWVNGTICIDTGCVFGGRLTALRWPERELVSVEAERVHYTPVRPLAPPESGQGDIGIEDVSGKRVIETRYDHPVTLRAGNTAAALEVMSRFAIDPRWLVYLPPTMSPPEAAPEGPFLEHPRECFSYYRASGVREVVCQEKHMGSRAVLVVCRDEDVARARFGEARLGVVTTRTGRPFFTDDASLEQALLRRVRDAAVSAGLFDALSSGWLVLDAELMPWSAKAQALLREQYARVGASGVAGLEVAVAAVEQAAARGVEGAADLRTRQRARLGRLQRYVEAYRRYCWPVRGIDDLALAPFHLLASEGAVHTDRDHLWHLETLARLAAEDPILRATRSRLVDLADPESERAATEWWLDLTDDGGEGMVVKPREWIVRDDRGLVQPAMKCRGREYLRIIYGPEYTDEDVMGRLRKRSLAGKRRLAVKELALGLEALARFASREPLHRVHECVFGVLALESEPIDPRL